MKRLTSMLLAMAVALGWVPAYAATVVPVTVQATVTPQLDLSVSILRVDADKGPEDYTTDAEWNNNLRTSMNFGALQEVTSPDGTVKYGIWGPTQYFAVYLVAKTSARAYTINQTAAGFGNLAKAFTMTPQYYGGDMLKWEVNGVPQTRANWEVCGGSNTSFSKPGEGVGVGNACGTLGTAKKAVGGPFVVFQSATSDVKNPIIRCDYGFYTGGKDSAGNDLDPAYIPDGIDPSNTADAVNHLLLIDSTPPGVYTGTVTFTLTLQ